MYLKLIFFQDWYYWYVYHDDKKRNIILHKQTIYMQYILI